MKTIIKAAIAALVAQQPIKLSQASSCGISPTKPRHTPRGLNHSATSA